MLKRRLSPVEAISVVVVVLVVTALSYLAYTFVSAELLALRVRTALPKVYADIRKQRQVLSDAIAAYKATFGFYPQDNVLSRQPLVVDAVKNPLLYELAGVVLDPAKNEFQVDHLEPANAKYVKQFLNVAKFNNCGERPEQVKRFLKIDPLPTRQLHDDPDVFAVGYYVPYEGLDPAVVSEIEVSPWRYVSTAPTNNPRRYDLWIEVNTKGHNQVIGNWKAVD